MGLWQAAGSDARQEALKVDVSVCLLPPPSWLQVEDYVD